MKYVTTLDPSLSLSFEQALFQGLGTDSSLIVPQSFPHINPSLLMNKSIPTIGTVLLKPFLREDIDSKSLNNIMARAWTFPFPLVTVGDSYILELFHGPTASFKDIAAQFLGKIMEFFLRDTQKEIVIATATSGDTGGAVAAGFGNKKNIKVVILYPINGVSAVQRSQLTHVADNIYPIEVDGSFDDCQKYVKQFFHEQKLINLNITSANSINIGRLLPQMSYYAYAWSKMRKNNLRFIIPSGNMGNVTAGLYVKRVGIPISQFHIACNANDPVLKYFETGKYKPQQSKKTISNAMDIGNPSNFERILHLYNNDLTLLSKDVTVSSTNDEETIKTIKDVYRTHNYLLDPHTAVAWTASQKTKSADYTDIIIATASPSKFVEEIELNTGFHCDALDRPISPQQLSDRRYSVHNSYDAILNQMITLFA